MIKGHPHKTTTSLNLATLLKAKGNYKSAESIYRKLQITYERDGGAVSSQFLEAVAICHNELAFHINVPPRNWKESEYRYQKSIELSNKLRNPVETADVELNLLTMYLLAGADSGEKWPKVDIDRVKELTRILEEASDKRAEKGYKLLKSLEGL